MQNFYKNTPQNQPLKTLYFGWGTPSLLKSEQIGDIITTIKKHQDFAEDIEITLEANPEDISESFLQDIYQAGVNRLSIGVQSLNIQTLQEVNRIPEIDFDSFFTTLDYGPIENIAMDFIIGLPHTKNHETEKNIQTALKKCRHIKHVSIYMLEEDDYPSTWKNISMPKEEYKAEFRSCMKLLQSWGLYQYEISNFAKPWYESKHNQCYWEHKNYRGFGLSAESFIDGERFGNQKHFSLYYKQEELYRETLSKEQKQIEYIMFQIRTKKGIPLTIVDEKKAKELQKEWLISIEDNLVSLTSDWIFLVDYIIEQLL